MVLFSNGDPLWSLEDKKGERDTLALRWRQDSECFCDLRNGNESQQNASIQILVLLLFRLVSVVCLLFAFFFAWNNVEKLALALTLETLGSKEVARWLVWLQNTKEHG